MYDVENFIVMFLRCLLATQLKEKYINKQRTSEFVPHRYFLNLISLLGADFYNDVCYNQQIKSKSAFFNAW